MVAVQLLAPHAAAREKTKKMLYRFALAAVLCLVASVARAESVVLANGDTINAEIIERGVDYIVIEHPELGPVRFSIEELDADPETGVDTEDPPNPGIFGTRALRGWSRTLDAGLKGKQGNSHTTSVTSGLNMGYEDERKRWDFRGRSFYERDEDGTSDNDGRFTLRRDHLLPESPWFGFGSVSYAFDQFESWKHRIVTSAGPGYRLVQRKAHELDVRLGATYTREFGSQDTDEANVMFGIDYSWELNDSHTFILTNQLFTEIQPKWGELRNLTIAEWTVKILQKPNLSLKAGAENEYATKVEKGDGNNDLKYFLSVGIDF